MKKAKMWCILVAKLMFNWRLVRMKDGRLQMGWRMMMEFEDCRYQT